MLQELQLAHLTADLPQVALGVGLKGEVNSQGAVHAMSSEDSTWGPLFRAVPYLTPLRKLFVERLLPAVRDSEVDVLRGASQLTCLKLAACGVRLEAAVTRLAFAHLPDVMLHTE